MLIIVHQTAGTLLKTGGKSWLLQVKTAFGTLPQSRSNSSAEALLVAAHMAKQSWRNVLAEAAVPAQPSSSAGPQGLIGEAFLDTFQTDAFVVGRLKAAKLRDRCVFVRSLYCCSEAPVIFKGHVLELWLVPDFFKRQTGIFRYCFFSIHFKEEKENNWT